MSDLLDASSAEPLVRYSGIRRFLDDPKTLRSIALTARAPTPTTIRQPGAIAGETDPGAKW